jgi:hypothetical protein
MLVACGSAPSRPVRVATDLEDAHRVLVSSTDLPGYNATPAADAAEASTVQAAGQFQECAGAGAALGDDNRTVQSPGYFKDRVTAVSSLAVVAADETAARTAMGDLSRANLAQCLTALYRTVLGLDLLPGTVAATDLLPTAKVGDQSITWRTTIHVAVGGQTVAAYSDLTFFRTGRTVASLFDFQVGDPFPTAERTRLVDAMATRAADI